MLNNCHEITDEGLRDIVETLKCLTCLAISGDNITDNGLRCIAQLSRLKKLTLQWCDITETVLCYIASLKRLRHVNISDCQHITSKGNIHVEA